MQANKSHEQAVPKELQIFGGEASLRQNFVCLQG